MKHSDRSLKKREVVDLRVTLDMKLLSPKPTALPQPSFEGTVKLLPETPEDLWHAYNLAAPGDEIASTAIRKVTKESSTGSVDSQRIRLTLSVRLERVEFDPEGGELRLSGRVTNEIEGVRLGSRHTLTVELHRAFTIGKAQWDSVSLERLAEATRGVESSADLAVVLMREGAAGGLAQLILVSGGMSIVRARLEASATPKKGDPRVLLGAKKAKSSWFDQLIAAVDRHVNFETVKCIVLAGPGFTKDSFLEYAFSEAERCQRRTWMLSKSKWVIAHASSAYKHALHEVLTDPAVAARISDTKAAGEVIALRDFFAMMNKEPDRVQYGFNYVRHASEQGAVEKLLLADSLFRVQHVAKRAQYVELVEACKAAGATVHIFSDLHASGEQLSKLGGVAALLRFPLPIEELFNDDDDDSSCHGDDGNDDLDDQAHED